MSSLTLEDPNNTAEKRTTLNATSPGETLSEDFVGDWILQVGPNMGGNRRPMHFVDAIQGISSIFGGRGAVGQAVLDFPGVAGEGRIGVLGTGDDLGVVGLVGLRPIHSKFPSPATTVLFHAETIRDVVPPGAKIVNLPQGALRAGVFGIGTGANSGVSGINLGPGIAVSGIGTGIGAGVVGQSDDGIGVSGASTDSGGGSGRGGIFQSRINAQVRLAPLQRQDITNPHNALPKDGVAGDLIAITVTVRGVPPPAEVTSLWFCTNTGTPANAVWKQLA
jgi:hypothetical protein